jgi:uncharacterized protein DUF3574
VRTVAAAVVLLAIAWSPSVLAQSLTCHGAQQPREVAELLFGRRIGAQGLVGEAAWRRFVAREITPRFPDGLTILAASGQWRDPSTQRIIREPSTLVMIAMPGKPEDHGRLEEIADAYKTLFRQQSVGIIVRPACVSF